MSELNTMMKISNKAQAAADKKMKNEQEALAKKAQIVAEKQAKKEQKEQEALAKKEQKALEAAEKKQAQKEKKALEAQAKKEKKALETAVAADSNTNVESPVKSDINIDEITEVIKKNTDTRIILMREREVIMWLCGDLSFLPKINKKNKTTDDPKYKVLEDKWGQETLKKKRPDLKLDKQWTNKFGEHLVEEFNYIIGKEVSKPVNKEHYQPDCEVDDAILEAKAQTFYTSGTAGEKILGCPFKYAEIPELYSKPLKIICMGGAERVCREQYGNLIGAKCTPQKKKFLDFFKENNIEYVGATDILKGLL
jgi:hypothetical protein